MREIYKFGCVLPIFASFLFELINGKQYNLLMQLRTTLRIDDSMQLKREKQNYFSLKDNSTWRLTEMIFKSDFHNKQFGQSIRGRSWISQIPRTFKPSHTSFNTYHVTNSKQNGSRISSVWYDSWCCSNSSNNNSNITAWSSLILFQMKTE